MPRAPSLIGRSFAEVLDEIGPWPWGVVEGGPLGPPIGPGSDAEVERARIVFETRLAPILAALRDGVVVLVDAEGNAVPRAAWFSGGWRFRRDNRRNVEWLEVSAEAEVKYYNPGFIRPAATGENRGGGNTRYDDTAVVELAKTEFKNLPKPSKHRAAEAVIDRLINAGKPVAGISREAWIKRVRQQL
jgi:hypothetical protein